MPRTTGMLAHQIKQIRDYLRMVPEMRAASMLPTSWGQDGCLASAGGGRKRYRDEAGFARALQSMLGQFEPHVVAGMEQAVKALPVPEQQVVRLVLVQGYTRRHVADILHISTRTISRWEGSALERLAHALWTDAGTPKYPARELHE